MAQLVVTAVLVEGRSRPACRVRAENRDTAFDQRFSRTLLVHLRESFWQSPPRDRAGAVLDDHQDVEAAPKRRFGRYDQTASVAWCSAGRDD